MDDRIWALMDYPKVITTPDGKKALRVIWRAGPKQLAREQSNPKYAGAGLRAIRASKGVGRPCTIMQLTSEPIEKAIVPKRKPIARRTARPSAPTIEPMTPAMSD